MLNHCHRQHPDRIKSGPPNFSLPHRKAAHDLITLAFDNKINSNSTSCSIYFTKRNKMGQVGRPRKVKPADVAVPDEATPTTKSKGRVGRPPKRKLEDSPAEDATPAPKPKGRVGRPPKRRQPESQDATADNSESAKEPTPKKADTQTAPAANSGGTKRTPVAIAELMQNLGPRTVFALLHSAASQYDEIAQMIEASHTHRLKYLAEGEPASSIQDGLEFAHYEKWARARMFPNLDLGPVSVDEEVREIGPQIDEMLDDMVRRVQDEDSSVRTIASAASAVVQIISYTKGSYLGAPMRSYAAEAGWAQKLMEILEAFDEDELYRVANVKSDGRSWLDFLKDNAAKLNGWPIPKELRLDEAVAFVEAAKDEDYDSNEEEGEDDEDEE